MTAGHLGDECEQLLVGIPGIAHPRCAAAEVACDLLSAQGAGEESVAQGTVGHEPHAEFGAGGNDVILDIA